MRSRIYIFVLVFCIGAIITAMIPELYQNYIRNIIGIGSVNLVYYYCLSRIKVAIENNITAVAQSIAPSRKRTIDAISEPTKIVCVCR